MNKISQVQELTQSLQTELQKSFVGTQDVIHTVLVGFLAGLHVLIEDIPGVGKTTLARSLAAASGMDFARIQFSPDLMPGDITGMTVWSQEKREFHYKPGAIMHQFILADELNRASERTQSALLEAMQDLSVSVDGKTHPLPHPFFLMATQNPLQFAGTFRLPENQLDRFGLSVSLGYPDTDNEITILDLMEHGDPLGHLKAVTTTKHIESARETVLHIQVHEKIKHYVVEISNATRKHPHVRLGMSPRASSHLLRAAQAAALMHGRSFVIPEDVSAVAASVISHRIILSPEVRMEQIDSSHIVKEVISSVALPTGVS